MALFSDIDDKVALSSMQEALVYGLLLWCFLLAFDYAGVKGFGL